jgi:hypothetical protein
VDPTLHPKAVVTGVRGKGRDKGKAAEELSLVVEDVSILSLSLFFFFTYKRYHYLSMHSFISCTLRAREKFTLRLLSS